MIRKISIVVLFLAFIVVAGCRNVAYNQHSAVEDARKFLLKNAPELTPVQSAFVRYNKPTFLVENILGSAGARCDRSQICISWLIPGQENVYMVFGVSELRMESWTPNRLIRKIFPKADVARLAAYSTARGYALNNLYNELSIKQYNHVRFADPDAIRTSFELKKSKLEQGVNQYSIVWKSSDSDDFIVICGTAKDDLSGFKVDFGGLFDKKELLKATLPKAKEGR